MRRSGTYILAGSLTFPSRARFEMRSWRKVLLKSIAGFRIPAGSLFVFAGKTTSIIPVGHAFVIPRYLLKTATDPRGLLEQESNLSPQFKSLLEPFVPKTENHVSTDPLPA
jgi:hypothetical protein